MKPYNKKRVDFLKQINIITAHCIQNNSDYYSGEYDMIYILRHLWLESSICGEALLDSTLVVYV